MAKVILLPCTRSCLLGVVLVAIYLAGQSRANLTPVDPVLPGWTLASSLCDECGEGTACDVLGSASQLNFSDGRVAAYPQGSALTCYKKDYSADFQATVGGRCLPALLGDSTAENFCEAVLPPKVPGRRLTNIVYQALAEQRKVCEPCCEGRFTCGGDLICKRHISSGEPGGFCTEPGIASTCFGEDADAVREIKCDSCLQDFSTRRQLSSKSKSTPSPSKSPENHCFELALAGQIQQLLSFLFSQPFQGRDLIGQLPNQLSILEPFVFSNYLQGAWGANRQATVSAVGAIWERDVFRSSQVFTELIGSNPQDTAFIYTAAAKVRIDLGATVLSSCLLGAHPTQAQKFLVASAHVRAFTAGTMWGTSYKSSYTASLDLFAHATAIANVTAAGKMARAATVAQEYASISVSAKEFVYLATSAGAPKENLAKFANVWQGV